LIRGFGIGQVISSVIVAVYAQSSVREEEDKGTRGKGTREDFTPLPKTPGRFRSVKLRKITRTSRMIPGH